MIPTRPTLLTYLLVMGCLGIVLETTCVQGIFEMDGSDRWWLHIWQKRSVYRRMAAKVRCLRCKVSTWWLPTEHVLALIQSDGVADEVY
jgi:hypothetical protein